jgi:hypothetical protein
MPVDELAAVSEREFESIRNEMATCEELKATEHPFETSGHLGNRVSVRTFHWNTEFERLADNISQYRKSHRGR